MNFRGFLVVDIENAEYEDVTELKAQLNHYVDELIREWKHRNADVVFDVRDKRRGNRTPLDVKAMRVAPQAVKQVWVPRSER